MSMELNQVKQVKVIPVTGRFVAGLLPKNERIVEEKTLYLNKQGIRRAMSNAEVFNAADDKLLDELNWASEEGAIDASEIPTEEDKDSEDGEEEGPVEGDGEAEGKGHKGEPTVDPEEGKDNTETPVTEPTTEPEDETTSTPEEGHSTEEDPEVEG